MTGRTYFEGSYNDPNRQINEARCSSKDDRELRRWCIEQVASAYVQAADRIEQAEALYGWVCNQPKADAA